MKSAWAAAWMILGILFYWLMWALNVAGYWSDVSKGIAIY